MKYLPILTELAGAALVAVAIYLAPPVGFAVGGAILIGLAQLLEGRER